MINYREKLFPNKYYHIFNHAVGTEYLFRNDRNYYYFLEKYNYYISPIIKTFAYCLMPNHFHFLVKIKPIDELPEKNIVSDNLYKTSNNLSLQFKKFFTSYTGAYNKALERKGTLFEPRFKRKSINDEDYFKNVLNYIHLNPVHHRFVKEKEEWKFSSFTSFYCTQKSLLQREEIYKLFESEQKFNKIHNLQDAEKFAIQMELSY